MKAYKEPVYAICENGHKIYHSGAVNKHNPKSKERAIEVPDLCVRCNARIVEIKSMNE